MTLEEAMRELAPSIPPGADPHVVESFLMWIDGRTVKDVSEAFTAYLGGYAAAVQRCNATLRQIHRA